MLDDRRKVYHALDDEVGLSCFEAQMCTLHDLLPSGSAER
jgi:hypothetical protein